MRKVLIIAASVAVLPLYAFASLILGEDAIDYLERKKNERA